MRPSNQVLINLVVSVPEDTVSEEAFLDGFDQFVQEMQEMKEPIQQVVELEDSEDSLLRLKKALLSKLAAHRNDHLAPSSSESHPSVVRMARM